MSYFIYILRTSSNTLYVGQTNDLDRRLEEHSKKGCRAAKYTKMFSSFRLVHTEVFSTRKEAMQRETQIKKWTKAKKEALIQGDTIKLKKILMK
ncbi:GIY-YIG nuclease family protein [Candidatus Collierbacteria bacterium]|nr:GIY-YIG nuclease family protein [Candidatus Collierbacteria bacterium]